MTEALMLAAAGGAMGAAAALLALLQVSNGRRSILKATANWTQMTTSKIVAVLAGLTVAAFACLATAVHEPDQTLLLTQYNTIEPANALSLLTTAPSVQSASGADEQDTTANSESSEAADRKDQALASLRDFASRIEDKRTRIASLGSDGAEAAALPDVDTMMERLRARLVGNPNDIKGWVTLGWAYANTGHYNESVTAYEEALKRDSENADIKSALDEVKNKAAK